MCGPTNSQHNFCLSDQHTISDLTLSYMIVYAAGYPAAHSLHCFRIWHCGLVIQHVLTFLCNKDALLRQVQAFCKQSLCPDGADLLDVDREPEPSDDDASEDGVHDACSHSQAPISHTSWSDGLQTCHRKCIYVSASTQPKRANSRYGGYGLLCDAPSMIAKSGWVWCWSDI